MADFRTESDIYGEITSALIETFGERYPEGTEIIAEEIQTAKADSENAVHYFFSPSKSNGWMSCVAYLERASGTVFSKEPSVRGTIVHHFLARTLDILSKKDISRQKLLDWINTIVFRNPKWLSKAGAESALALIKRCVELGIENVESETHILSDTLGVPNKNLRFGGSIDVLCVKETKKHHCEVWIYDLKTGKTPVSPDSWQLKCYALLVSEMLKAKRNIETCDFILGIAQDGKVKEYEFPHGDFQKAAFTDIKRKMKFYEDVYLKYKDTAEDEEENKEYSECFNPCPYCRFCDGCKKRGLVW